MAECSWGSDIWDISWRAQKSLPHEKDILGDILGKSQVLKGCLADGIIWKNRLGCKSERP